MSADTLSLMGDQTDYFDQKNELSSAEFVV